MRRQLIIAAVLLLSACEAKVGKEADRSADDRADSSPEAAAGEANQFSLKIPGFEMKVDMPDEGVRTDEDSDILFPGSRLTGMSIDAGKGTSQESVELRFHSPEAVRQVVAWYRDPARSAKFTLSSVAEEGEGYRMAGTQKDGDGRFDLWLSPAGGGTNGRIVLRDRS